ncbi:MAG: hypothetical protein FWC96_05110 [Oscillospiraceae bacterium]|nr:hypothetical protein [Oscillospiraceae bacterium]
MSTKRILGIAVFGAVLCAAAIGIMLITTFFRSDNIAFELPRTAQPAMQSPGAGDDSLIHVEVTPETVQAVIGETLSRPETYIRYITIESFWAGGGWAVTDIRTSVTAGAMSLMARLPDGVERRIITTQNSLYIWYGDESSFYTGPLAGGDRAVDEWRMLPTYEDVLLLPPADIIYAGFTELNGELCIYVVYRSPLFGFIRRYYISIELGLVIGAEEFDETGARVYRMTAGEIIIGETDPEAFILPNGFSVL